MKKIKGTSFPDKKLLMYLIDELVEKADTTQDPLEKLISHSNASMNWVSDYLMDETVRWKKKTLKVDNLYLTGTNPQWNEIIINRCERSPKKLRELIKSDKKIAKLFKDAKTKTTPILVRYDDTKYKLFDGMHRTVAAIRDGKKTINAYIAYPSKSPQIKCDPHIIYDLLKVYHKKITTDRKGLITSLRYLRKSYANVDDLLVNRFNISYVPSEEIQEIIREALKD